MAPQPTQAVQDYLKTIHRLGGVERLVSPAEIAARLDESEIGAKDLALCGGACGGDILFAEECVKRGAQVRLMIALPLDEFIPASVSFAGSHWIQIQDDGGSSQQTTAAEGRS